MRNQRFTPHWKNIYLFLVDKQTNWKPKVFLALAIVYLLWPIDLAPDLIPFFGWLDDIGFGTIALWYLSRTARNYSELKASDKEKR